MSSKIFDLNKVLSPVITLVMSLSIGASIYYGSQVWLPRKEYEKDQKEIISNLNEVSTKMDALIKSSASTEFLIKVLLDAKEDHENRLRVMEKNHFNSQINKKLIGDNNGKH